MDENRVCHIGKLIVHPDFQNKGIGRELMTEIERLFPHCHKFSLFTGEETPNTLHLYSKVGYNIVCRKEMEGISMIIMEKEKLFCKGGGCTEKLFVNYLETSWNCFLCFLKLIFL